MNPDLFEKWQYALIDEAYDWKQIGISNDYCNNISVPKYGLEIIDWTDMAFRVVDEKKYAVFLLRFQ